MVLARAIGSHSEVSTFPLAGSAIETPDLDRTYGERFVRVLLETEQALSVSSESPAPLFSTESSQSVLEDLEALPAEARVALRTRWGGALNGLIALSRETNPRLFCQGLIHLARRLEDADHLNQANLLLTALRDRAFREIPDSIRSQAEERLQILNGGGSLGEQLSFAGRRILREAWRPESLLAMFAAQWCFHSTYFYATRGLMRALGDPLFARGVGWGVGFLAESIAFTGVGKVAGAAFGTPQDFSLGATANQWAGGALMLLSLKAFGAGASYLGPRYFRGPGTLERFSRLALPHVGLWGGIWVGQRLEEIAEFHPVRDPADGLIESLRTFVEFRLSGYALERLAGPTLRRWNLELADLEAELNRRRPPWDFSGALVPAVSGIGAVPGSFLPEPGRLPSDLLGGHKVYMVGDREGSSEIPASPAASAPPPAPNLAETRYHLPDTPYFAELRNGMSLETLSVYARARYRAMTLGNNLTRALHVPLEGSTEYSPGGADIVEAHRVDPMATHRLGGKWERALVASPGTAILGLGSASISPEYVVRAEAADAIMEGKVKYFLSTAGVSADPLCVRCVFSRDEITQLDAMAPRARDEQARIWRAQKFANHVAAIANNFGFINVEDAQGKDLPLILGALETLGDTAIWSDDKQGTGVIAAAAMLSWADLTQRSMSSLRGVIFGAGAGSMGVYDELLNHGVLPENILATDSRGAIHGGRRDIENDPYKVRMREGIPEGMTVERFAHGADFLINLGVKETFTDNLVWTEGLVRGLAPNFFFGPMTNPEPGISPTMLRNVREDSFCGTGNQLLPNPINNFTVFGYIGAGALMAQARGVGPRMTVAAALGIREVAKLGPPPALRSRLGPTQQEFGRDWLVPRPDDIRLIELEAGAVARAAAEEGLSLLVGENPSPRQMETFNRELAEKVRFRLALVESMRSRLPEDGRRYWQMRYPDRHAPFSLRAGDTPIYDIAPAIDRRHFEYFAQQMGIKPERWASLVTPDGGMHPTSLTDVLLELRGRTEEDTIEARTAFQELRIISLISTISPPLGLALGLRRTRVRPENMAHRPTIFHREAVLRTVLRTVPEARLEIESNFQGIPRIE